MDSKIGFEMNVIVVEAIRGRCASFTVLTAIFGYIWWTDNPIYFSSIDVNLFIFFCFPRMIGRDLFKSICDTILS